MAKDRELADHERAHSGKPGAKVQHGMDFEQRIQAVREQMPEYGYRKVHGAVNYMGPDANVSVRQVRKHMKIGKEYQDED